MGEVHFSSMRKPEHLILSITGSVDLSQTLHFSGLSFNTYHVFSLLLIISLLSTLKKTKLPTISIKVLCRLYSTT